MLRTAFSDLRGAAIIRNNTAGFLLNESRFITGKLLRLVSLSRRTVF
ncbi:hypothetical protein [Succinimonas amylolytica]|nr:hypothetical protein [Succinimonas amylolytica]